MTRSELTELISSKAGKQRDVRAADAYFNGANLLAEPLLKALYPGMEILTADFNEDEQEVVNE